MKKKYISPELETTLIPNNQVICTSINVDIDSNESDDQDSDKSKFRDFNLFDDESEY